MKKLVFVISFIVLSGFLFGLSAPDAKAATVAELQAQIQQLMAQIVALQQQLSQLQPKPIDWCHTFNVNLKIGDRGSEVNALVIALTKEGFIAAEERGLYDMYEFNEGIASAVVGFQEKYASEVLAPWRLTRGTGYVGPSTRAKLNKLYGCEGKEVCVQKGSTCCLGEECVVLTIDCIEPLFSVFKGCNANCHPRWECLPSTPSITVTSPNGGERWQAGTTQTIRWASSGVTGTVAIQLEKWSSDRSSVFVSGIGQSLVTAGSYSWPIPSNQAVGSYYKIKISLLDNTPVGGAGVTDSSDNYFSIVSASTACTDSDGGKNYYVRGTAYDKGNYINGGQDSCFSHFQYDRLVLNEYYCESGVVKSESYNCPYGCKDGACLVKCDGVNMTWDSDLIKPKPYSYTTDTCAGYRCLIGNGISSSCYNFAECQNACKGECVNISAAKKQCATTPSITVISPNGGEQLVRGSTYTVKWESKGVNLVRIYIFNPNISGSGSTNYIVPNNQTISASQGYYNWTIGEVGLPTGVDEGAVYKVRIDDANSSLSDSSDNYLSIVSATPVCTDSDGGKNYYQKGTVIYDEKGYTDYCLGAFYLREYFCLPQSSIGLGGVAYEDIVCPNNYSCRDGVCVSPAIPASITVISPNGGEKWAFGVPQTIKWTSSGIASGKTVGLYLMATSNLMCHIANADALSGIYTITLKENQSCSNPYFPNLVAGQYKVFIDAAAATGIENLGDSSDNYFDVGSEEMLVPGHDFYVKTADTGTGNWSFAKGACEGLGSGWTLPTMTQLRILYQKKNEIGGFKDDAYWSSDMGMYIHFINGFESSMNPAMTFPSFRCVKKADVLGLQVTESQFASLSNIVSRMIEQFMGLLWR